MLDDYYDVELKCEEPITIDGFDAEPSVGDILALPGVAWEVQDISRKNGRTTLLCMARESSDEYYE